MQFPLNPFGDFLINFFRFTDSKYILLLQWGFCTLPLILCTTIFKKVMLNFSFRTDERSSSGGPLSFFLMKQNKENLRKSPIFLWVEAFIAFLLSFSIFYPVPAQNLSLVTLSNTATTCTSPDTCTS